MHWAWTIPFLIVLTYANIELKLVRVPHKSKIFNKKPAECPQKTKEQNNEAEYKEICYDKDIVYAIEVFRNNQLHIISVDTTIPIGWLKGNQCHTIQGKKCSRLQVNFKDKIKSVASSIKKKLHKHTTDEEEETSDAVIAGSSELVEGEIKRSVDLQLDLLNSNRLSNVIDLILLGLFVYGERDNVTLKSTNYLQATQISLNLNYLCDGALPLRFDQNSENSFLNQIFSIVGNDEKVVSIYLNQEKSVLVIGQLTTKYSQAGYSGVSWVSLATQDDDVGKMPSLTELALEDKHTGKRKKVKVDTIAVLTVSASYIGLPKEVMSKFLQKCFVSDLKCQVSGDSKYVECQGLKKVMKKQVELGLDFSFGDVSISLPLESLLIYTTSKLFRLRIRQVSGQYAILGQPIFNKYCVSFDYRANKIGFARKRTYFGEGMLNPITILHIVINLFFYSCLIVCMLVPAKKILNAIKKQGIYGSFQAKRNQPYSSIQDNLEEPDGI